MGRIFRQSHERLTDEGFLETVACLPPDFSIDFSGMQQEGWNSLIPYCIHPDTLDGPSEALGAILLKLVFLPPLGIEENRLLHRLVRM